MKNISVTENDEQARTVESEFDRLAREEAELRAAITYFEAGDMLSRDKLYDRSL